MIEKSKMEHMLLASEAGKLQIKIDSYKEKIDDYKKVLFRMPYAGESITKHINNEIFVAMRIIENCEESLSLLEERKHILEYIPSQDE